MNPVKILRVTMTLAIAVAAVMVSLALWDHYMTDPWTRDGRVRADVVDIAPDVAGMIVNISIHDNEFVHKGDPLFTIDPQRYQLAVSLAEAKVKAAEVALRQRQIEAERRQGLDSRVVTREARETASSDAAEAEALLGQARAELDLARLNLQRTQVVAPADGYVTNFTARIGDYATVGKSVVALIDAHSFRVVGYFEETKLPKVRAGDPVEIRMMDGRTFTGSIDSVPRGINDHNDAVGRSMLADVNPTYNWVRLAQRVPVRIKLDDEAASQRLIAGQTCTVVVKPRSPVPTAQTTTH